MMRQEAYGRYAGGLVLCALALLRLPLPLPLTAALWCGLFAALYYRAPRICVPAEEAQRSAVMTYAFLGAITYLTAFYLLGVILTTLAVSPYDHSPVGLLMNLVRILPPLIGRELVRAYGFGAAWRRCKHRKTAIVLLTALLFIADLQTARLFQLNSLQSIVVYAAQTFVPDLARDIALSVFVFYGGAAAGIVYAVIPAVFEWVSPFLPTLPWLAHGAIGVCLPLVLAAAVSDRFRAQGRERRVQKERGTVGFAAALTCSVLFLWFLVGVFPVFPSVVLTGSMEPMVYPGDAVLIRKLTEEQDVLALAEGDVINFKREQITITHRIIGIERDEAGNLAFQTKGDNNDAADVQRVSPNDINGTVRHVIPKVGLPILILHSGQETPEGVTDNE